jgi:hypothetical protein
MENIEMLIEYRAPTQVGRETIEKIMEKDFSSIKARVSYVQTLHVDYVLIYCADLRKGWAVGEALNQKASIRAIVLQADAMFPLE